MAGLADRRRRAGWSNRRRPDHDCESTLSRKCVSALSIGENRDAVAHSSTSALHASCCLEAESHSIRGPNSGLRRQQSAVTSARSTKESILEALTSHQCVRKNPVRLWRGPRPNSGPRLAGGRCQSSGTHRCSAGSRLSMKHQARSRVRDVLQLLNSRLRCPRV